MAEKNLEKEILKKLENVIDPELNISIIDLGLVYEVKYEQNIVNIRMTLTSLGCPLFYTIEQDIRQQLSEFTEIKDVLIELTFDPPWSMENLSEKAKAIMGI